MLGLRQLSWIDDRLREAFPHRNEDFFGRLNILLVGDFSQLPSVHRGRFITTKKCREWRSRQERVYAL